ncbi:putative Carbamoyltransferase [Vibrio nigripulchritudo SOn1]|uniref:Carbamoyltransferase n=1 Tax=Vibrio nigripulchritudo SOn1 TaxID=1238450 RepID=A0AAV2VYU3_9VIBR|nr:carbamoyltransferase C-terminal domain-containing protein [Vibrio nigripulchritudo]CCO49772.1 putative Carbamoyltransferase [Vibrio nigripulchritudo SOn1]
MGSVTLGIHLGHHCSCAIVIDGELKSAIQLERVSREKHAGKATLTHEVPIENVLNDCALSINDVSNIIISVQQLAVGGDGLHFPLFDDSFDFFDIADKRVRIISHHLAHAVYSYGCSGFDNSSVLVSDLAGSTTPDGLDFDLSYEEFKALPTSKYIEPKTESISLYRITFSGIDLLEREYTIPHPSPSTFIYSPASLYDNVSRFIFGREDCHGQLMALSGLKESGYNNDLISINDMIDINDGKPIFKNNWSRRFNLESPRNDLLTLAKITQEAFVESMMCYVRKIRHISKSNNFCASGGTFLNISLNSKILESRKFKKCYFPSSPHDAGISIGCAFYGDKIWEKPLKKPIKHDIFSPTPNFSIDESDLTFLLKNNGCYSDEKIALLLSEGAVIARFYGNAEFGPRALGARSIIATPTDLEIKNKLNRIKQRQMWRPVAPIVLKESLKDYFDGPEDSPFMNLIHKVKPEYHSLLPALCHQDNTSRCQTLNVDNDIRLYNTLNLLPSFDHPPIILNTSLNGPGQPTILYKQDAIKFFLVNHEIDFIIINDEFYSRNETIENIDLNTVIFNKEVVFTIKGNNYFALLNNKKLKIDEETFNLRGKIIRKEQFSKKSLFMDLLFNEFLIKND